MIQSTKRYVGPINKIQAFQKRGNLGLTGVEKSVAIVCGIVYNTIMRIPESLHNRVKQLASEYKISINQFITSPLAEKISALEAGRYIEERAKRGDVDKFREVLSKIPDVEPKEYDKL